MNAIQEVEARIRSLETSRNRSRLAAWAFGLALVVVSAAAIAPQAVPDATPQEAPTPQDVTARTITLTNAEAGSSIILEAGPGSSLLIQTTDGDEIARIGGPSARYSK